MPDHETLTAEVLTLAEAAAYLRVTEEEVLHLAEQREIPAKKIGGQWRLLKRALADWLRSDHLYQRDFWGSQPPWVFHCAPSEEWLEMLETRLRKKLATTVPASATEPPTDEPGSKQAVRKYFGIWRDDPSVEAMLGEIYKRRQEEPEEAE